MPRVLVFDFGNVLLRWDPHAILQRAGAIETGAETSERIARAFASALWTDFDRGLAPADEVVAGLERRTSLPEVVCRQFIEHAPDWLEPITPSVRLLEELFDARDRGAMDARIAFLSNMPAPWAAVLR
jgi:putative hydrolase of the HAD superfamily